MALFCRLLVAVRTAAVLALGAFACAGAAIAKERLAPGDCRELEGVAVLATPLSPSPSAPLRVVVASEKPLSGVLTLVAPGGERTTTGDARRGGPPYFWTAQAPEPQPGTWLAKLTLDAEINGCKTLLREISVRRAAGGFAGRSDKSVWPVRAAWDRNMENLYAVWIETLFDAPADAQPSWPALHEVLREPSRNILFNHLGLREDEKGLVIRPDCADLPYFLRAYFAFKMGLPFGYAKCTRGGRGKPPKCSAWWDIQNREPPPAVAGAAEQAGIGQLFGAVAPPPEPPKQRAQGLAEAFATYLGEAVAQGVHSGTGRVPAASDFSDYYAVPLTAETLRPGTVYHDPYGHILVIAKRVAQTPDSAGIIFAVDGQPDGTVARKRFWRGNFLFAQDPALGSPGFKRFRPVVHAASGLRRLTNAEIAKSRDYGDYSLEQTKLGVEDFYDRMDDLMSPQPLDPERAMMAAVAALEEQVKARVTSVENGRKFHTRGGGEVAMPDGPSIFETSGPWEDFATPSRDLRLLIAIDVVRGFPDRVARRPHRYAMPAGKGVTEVKTGLESKLAAELAARTFAYTRSDGSEWTLKLSEVLDRAADFEMAYNLNDCVEARWGAAESSPEAATCKRRASRAQRTKMADYRVWFKERRRPPRG
jgi:hypothetical protein